MDGVKEVKEVNGISTNVDNSVLEIPFKVYISTKMALMLGKEQYITVDGVETEVVLINNDVFVKSTMRKVDFFQEPVPLPNQSVIENMPHYRTIRSYYGIEPMSVAGCSLFVSEEKKEFSIYNIVYDAQLTPFDKDLIKNCYWPKNNFIPPAIFEKMIYYIGQNYLNKRLILKCMTFTGTSAFDYTD